MHLDELLISQAFGEYQKEQVKAIVHYLNFKLMAPKLDAQEMQGALELASIVLKLPLSLLKDKKSYADQVTVNMEKSFIDLRLNLLKERIANE